MVSDNIAQRQNELLWCSLTLSLPDAVHFHFLSCHSCLPHSLRCFGLCQMFLPPPHSAHTVVFPALSRNSVMVSPTLCSLRVPQLSGIIQAWLLFVALGGLFVASLPTDSCSAASGSTHVRKTCLQKKKNNTQSTFSHEIN